MTSSDGDPSHEIGALGSAPTQTIAAIPPAAPPYPTGAEAKDKNVFAVPALVLGILPVPPLGIVFGVLGIVRALTVKIGKTMSIVGLVLSALWATGGIAAVFVTPHVLKASNAGCQVVARYDRDYPPSKVAGDLAAGAPYATDLRAFSAALAKAASLTQHTEVRTAALTELADVELLLQYVSQQAQPDAATLAKQKSDDDVLRQACGSY